MLKKVIIENTIENVFCYFLKQLKNATDLLDQEGSTFRAVLEEVNRTLSIKVKLNWSKHPSSNSWPSLSKSG